ncbi:MAG TPA: NUDIX domain-containing protein [Candidatus Paceibacterota bacterium]|nr:NUDIX domain-containing protein [Candidatus Paceibacterota bacterium]
MKTLAIIRDADVGSALQAPNTYSEQRFASRAVVYRDDKKVGLLHVANKHYHKLPGGGFEGAENAEPALRREVLEEIGFEIKHIRELGIVEEYRNKYSLHQISYCFVAEINGPQQETNLDPAEAADGFTTIWLSVHEAVQMLESEEGVEEYEGKFIQKRDLLLLKMAAQFIV